MKSNKKSNTNDFPLYLFYNGKNSEAYRFFGVHPVKKGRGKAHCFRVWAPRALSVSVVGDFNNWDRTVNPMERISEGIWETTVSNLKQYDCYKYSIETPDGRIILKSDPYGRHFETRPYTASKIYESSFEWNDSESEWSASKKSKVIYKSPVNIYEVHLGSWKCNDDGVFLNYVDFAKKIIPYIKKMSYTHVEFMPLTEYPFDGSWGYQVTGYFAPTSRYGTPDDFKEMITLFHDNGIGVILDWVPAHFPKDESGLYEFDGTCCYEYTSEYKKEHKAWGTRVFDYGRPEVCSFLISSACFWFDEYHIDGLRVDAVASMLYLDYDRKPGEWFPNEDGTNINRQSVAFFKTLNATVKEYFPDALMIAEESTAYPEITYKSGLGFNFKWNMGWMNDTLSYIETDSYFRSGCHHKMTFSIVYAFGESYILPISHDEVVHGKKSLIDKMFGPYENKFPQLRTYLAFMMAHPGKKLLFMGCEFAQFREWDFENSLEWFMLDYPKHKETQDYVRALNHFYLSHPALWERDRDYGGFRWLDADRCGDNTYIFERYDLKGNRVVCVFNFSPNEYRSYGIPAEKGAYTEIFNTDKPCYGGSGCDNPTRLSAKKAENGGFFLKINVPAFGACFFRYTKPRTSNKKQEGIKGHD